MPRTEPISAKVSSPSIFRPTTSRCSAGKERKTCSRPLRAPGPGRSAADRWSPRPSFSLWLQEKRGIAAGFVYGAVEKGRRMTRMSIDYLADHLDLAATLAEWHHREWADSLPG